MSESVWHEQVCEGLCDFITHNISLNKSPVRCRVRKPDEDFKKEDYPLISIYNLYNVRDDFRRAQRDVELSKNVDTRTILVEQAALPFNLFYQIDFWSQQQSQMDSMTMQWINATQGGKDFNLPVVDNGGHSRTCYCLCKGDLGKSDLLEGTSRTFHSFITYRIYAEIDENVQKVEPLVTSLQIGTSPRR